MGDVYAFLQHNMQQKAKHKTQMDMFSQLHNEFD